MRNKDKQARLQSQDAQRRVQSTTAEVTLLRRQVEHLEHVVEAMWFLLRQTAPEGEAHERLCLEIERRLEAYARVAGRRPAACPTCGRNVSLLAGRCLYCSPDVPV